MNQPVAPALQPLPIDVSGIIKMLPHRYPFLLVDRVIAYEPCKSLVALKNVSINEHFFLGHFPGHPVMPGVLVIEALAQASGLLVQLSIDHNASQKALFYLVKVDKARFLQVVEPGDQLELHVTQKRMIRNMGQFQCQAKVDGKVVAEAELLCAERAA
ncbi:MAG: 3-hydroxyacyl-ACP dehydratase FabZ [Dokdonella sp.]